VSAGADDHPAHHADVVHERRDVRRPLARVGLVGILSECMSATGFPDHANRQRPQTPGVAASVASNNPPPNLHHGALMQSDCLGIGRDVWFPPTGSGQLAQTSSSGTVARAGLGLAQSIDTAAMSRDKSRAIRRINIGPVFPQGRRAQPQYGCRCSLRRKRGLTRTRTRKPSICTPGRSKLGPADEPCRRLRLRPRRAPWREALSTIA